MMYEPNLFKRFLAYHYINDTQMVKIKIFVIITYFEIRDCSKKPPKLLVTNKEVMDYSEQYVHIMRILNQFELTYFDKR